MGIREIQLFTNGAFDSNIAFYSKRGYQVYDRRTVPHPNRKGPATVVFMRKTLPSTR
jgi:hypothetical protein